MADTALTASSNASLAWLLLQFGVCALPIARAGFVLSRSAGRLAGLHGWGRGWGGLALLASGLVIVGLLMRPQGRVLRVTSWISIGLVSAYAINVALVYLSTG